jgi:hypothetical protein
VAEEPSRESPGGRKMEGPHALGDPMEEQARLGAKGVNGTLFVAPDRIVIRRKRALLVILSQGLKRTIEKEVAVEQVAGTRLKPATAFVNGYLRLSIDGEPEPAGGGLDAAQDINAIMFNAKQQPGFEAAQRLIERYRAAGQDDGPEQGESDSAGFPT